MEESINLETLGSQRFEEESVLPVLSRVHSLEITGEIIGNMNEIVRWNLKTVDLWALGITITIGGQFITWNEGLSAGFGSFLICTCLVGFAYCCMIICVAELSSALPFAGDHYGN